MQKTKLLLYGVLIGVTNSLFGAGGGIIAVPILKKEGLTQKAAQASAIAVILPLSLISAVMYLTKGYFALSDASVFIPFGFLGALLGSRLMGRFSDRLLGVLFSVLMIYSGLRMILKAG